MKRVAMSTISASTPSPAGGTSPCHQTNTGRSATSSDTTELGRAARWPFSWIRSVHTSCPPPCQQALATRALGVPVAGITTNARSGRLPPMPSSTSSASDA